MSCSRTHKVANSLISYFSKSLNRGKYETYSLCTSKLNATSSEVILNTSVPSVLCTEDNSIATNLSVLSDRTTEAGFTEDLSYDPNYSETDAPQVKSCSFWNYLFDVIEHLYDITVNL